MTATSDRRVSRYDARVTVVVSFDAATQDEAQEIAATLAETVIVKPPSGSAAEFVRSFVSKLVKHGA